VPELNQLANLTMAIPYNKDSCRIGPREWVQLARLLHRNRAAYDAFVVRACNRMLTLPFPVSGTLRPTRARLGPGDAAPGHRRAPEQRPPRARQIVHGTDTLSYTASALSLMLAGFKKPIVITGARPARTRGPCGAPGRAPAVAPAGSARR